MGELLRRRALMTAGESENWQPLSTKVFTAWSRSSMVTVSDDSVVFTPNAFSWAFTLTANGLSYKWGQVKNKKLRVKLDFDISNISGKNARFSASVGLYNTANPGYGTTRYGNFDLSWDTSTGTVVSPFGENGTHHFEYEGPFKTMSGTVNDNYYVGMRLYAYTGSGSTVSLSNVVFEILDQ